MGVAIYNDSDRTTFGLVCRLLFSKHFSLKRNNAKIKHIRQVGLN